MKLLLIGLRGSGKSTVGRRVADALGVGFCDLDELTPRRMGHARVADAWRARGEDAFREAEAGALEEVLAGEAGVVSLGGGTPTAPGVAARLEALRQDGAARVVYLRAGADDLRRRLAGAENTDRPSLTGAGTLEEIEAVLAARDGLYRRLADVVVETAGQNASQVTERVLAAADRQRRCP